jgi:hypothetical protein
VPEIPVRPDRAVDNQVKLHLADVAAKVIVLAVPALLLGYYRNTRDRVANTADRVLDLLVNHRQLRWYVVAETSGTN